jgi:hypothetical protein
MNYYILETVSEAKQFRDYAKKPSIDVADIRLAISSRNSDMFTRPLPLSTIKQIAESKNEQRLEKIDTIASITEECEGLPRSSKL